MKVKGSQARNRQQFRLQNLPVCGHDKDIRLQITQLRQDFRTIDSRRLKDGNVILQSQLFDLVHVPMVSSPFAVRLSKNAHDRMTVAFHQRAKRW